jgi:hypothetical protein
MSTKTVTVVLGLDIETAYGTFVPEVQKKINALKTTGASVITPNPAIATVQTNLNAFIVQEGTAKTHIEGGAAEAKVMKMVVLENVTAWKVQVQAAVTAAADVNTGIVIAQNCGFTVKKPSNRNKSDFEVRNVSPGVVELIAKAVARRQAWEWQISTDGVSFSSLPATLEAKTLVSSLTSGTKYYFRARPVLEKKKGVQPWTNVISIIVT